MPSEAPSDVSDSATLTKVHGWDEKNKMSLIRYVGYWPSVGSRWLDIGQVLCCVFMEAEVHKLAKKRTRPISSHIDRTSLVNRRFMYGFRENFSCRIQRAVPSGSHLSRSGSQSQRAIWSILPAHGASHIIIANSTFWIMCHGLRFLKTSALIFQTPLQTTNEPTSFMFDSWYFVSAQCTAAYSIKLANTNTKHVITYTSRAVAYDTFGVAPPPWRKFPMARIVMTPRDTRAGVDSGSIQNDIQLRRTTRVMGR